MKSPTLTPWIVLLARGCASKEEIVEGVPDTGEAHTYSDEDNDRSSTGTMATTTPTEKAWRTTKTTTPMATASATASRRATMT